MEGYEANYRGDNIFNVYITPTPTPTPTPSPTPSPTPTPTPSQESFPFNAKVVVTSGNTVNFRSSPKKANNLICRINKGETVKVTGEESGWYVVTYENQKGYIMKEFLVKV